MISKKRKTPHMSDEEAKNTDDDVHTTSDTENKRNCNYLKPLDMSWVSQILEQETIQQEITIENCLQQCQSGENLHTLAEFATLLAVRARSRLQKTHDLTSCPICWQNKIPILRLSEKERAANYSGNPSQCKRCNRYVCKNCVDNPDTYPDISVLCIDCAKKI